MFSCFQCYIDPIYIRFTIIYNNKYPLIDIFVWIVCMYAFYLAESKRRAARFCHNDYKTIEKGCMSEMMGKLNLEPLNIRRTNRRLTIFQKGINGHLALPIGHLQPVLRRTRHLNSKSYNTIHTSKDCYKYSFFPRTIQYWNSLPDKLATIK